MTAFVGAANGTISASDVDDQPDPLFVGARPHVLDVLDSRRNQFRAVHDLTFSNSS
jgi:hypothetical protein